MSQDKLHTPLRSLVSEGRADQSVRVIVQLKANSPLRRPSLISRAPAAYHFRRLQALVLEMSAGEVGQLAQHDTVMHVWQDLPVHTMLNTSVTRSRAPRLWSRGLSGKGVKIAFIDTGVDESHPDLQGRIADATSFVSRTPHDGNGHGTHVASVAVGNGAASNGLYRGVAPKAELLIAKALADDGSGYTSDVMAGIEWAVEQGAQVVNLSLGGDDNSDGNDALSTLCDLVWAQGIVVCVAAGNMGPHHGTVGSPGCARDVITVGASTDRDEVAPFSARGPTMDGRPKPDILFPGEGIVAARASNTHMGNAVNARYTELSGTSMATPHASGACALMLETKPDLKPDTIKKVMMGTALDLGLDPDVQGAGRGDVYSAFRLLPSRQQPRPKRRYFLPGFLRALWPWSKGISRRRATSP